MRPGNVYGGASSKPEPRHALLSTLDHGANPAANKSSLTAVEEGGQRCTIGLRPSMQRQTRGNPQICGGYQARGGGGGVRTGPAANHRAPIYQKFGGGGGCPVYFAVRLQKKSVENSADNSTNGVVCRALRAQWCGRFVGNFAETPGSSAVHFVANLKHQRGIYCARNPPPPAPCTSRARGGFKVCH